MPLILLVVVIFGDYELLSLNNQLSINAATEAENNCTKINAGASEGAIPEKVLVIVLAIVTAGLAKEVDEVNQYPALINSPTA